MNKDKFYDLLKTIKAGQEAEEDFFSLIYNKAQKAYFVGGGNQYAGFAGFSIDEAGKFHLRFNLPGGEPDGIEFASVDQFFNIDLDEELAKKRREVQEKIEKRRQAKEEEEKAMLAKLKAKYEPEVDK